MFESIKRKNWQSFSFNSKLFIQFNDDDFINNLLEFNSNLVQASKTLFDFKI